MGDWMPPYGIVFVSDMLSGLFGFMVASVMLAGVLYTVQSKDKCIHRPAFMSLFLTMETGLLGAMYTGDIFTLFVFIEITVISSVAMVAISDDRLGLEAAIKYVFISSLGTVFLLLGIAAVYVTFGTVNFADLAASVASSTRRRTTLNPCCCDYAHVCIFIEKQHFSISLVAT